MAGIGLDTMAPMRLPNTPFIPRPIGNYQPPPNMSNTGPITARPVIPPVITTPQPAPIMPTAQPQTPTQRAPDIAGQMAGAPRIGVGIQPQQQFGIGEILPAQTPTPIAAVPNATQMMTPGITTQAQTTNVAAPTPTSRNADFDADRGRRGHQHTNRERERSSLSPTRGNYDEDADSSMTGRSARTKRGGDDLQSHKKPRIDVAPNFQGRTAAAPAADTHVKPLSRKDKYPGIRKNESIAAYDARTGGGKANARRDRELAESAIEDQFIEEVGTRTYQKHFATGKYKRQ
jgi:hypothetical protein